METRIVLVRWRRRAIAIATVLFLLMLGLSRMASAQVMADYTAEPIFITKAVPPNILLLLDNSGSMNEIAYATPFDQNKAYYGIFDSFECYSYGSNKFSPNPGANPSTPGTCSASYPWSGNLLNYVSMRRIDIAKWVMMGGICSVGGRDAQGNCRQLIGQSNFGNTCCLDQTQSITVAQAAGRMPAASIPAGGSIYFHVMGSIGALKGSICVDNDATQPNGGQCTDNDAYNETNWQIRVDLFQNASGIVQNVGSKARFGLMEFKGAGDGGQVLSDVGGNIQSLITAIESTTPTAWTPLAESLYEASRYFAQIQPAYTNSDYSYNVTNRDPYYFTQPDWTSRSQYVTCCKSYIIIFTDGQPSQDLNVPAGMQDYAHAALAHGASNHCTVASGCTSSLAAGSGAPPKHSNTSSNFHDTLTEHHDNCSAYYGGSLNDSCVSSGSHYLDDVAYFAHTTDLRQGTIPVINAAGKDLAGMQNLTVYTFYAFGSGSRLLKDASKAGGFEDRNGNNLPDLPEEYDRVNNLTGAAGADGDPDTYFESSDADQMRDRLMATISSILQRSSSGTSISVLASSITGEGALYQAYFYPSTFEGVNEVKWTGYTQGLFIDEFGNFREDSNADGRLSYVEDKIVRTRYDATTGEVKVDRYTDSNGDGKLDGSPVTVTLKEMLPIWEAGKQLALTDPANRTILTWVDANGDGSVQPTEPLIPFTTANSATLAPYLRPSAAPFTADNIIDFIRGSEVIGLRDRQLTVGGSLHVWKLGDIINSTPTIVGSPKERYDVLYGDDTYTNYFVQYRARRQMVYVGANDGMLHAFNAGYYHRGDDPSSPAVTEHGWFTTTPANNAGGDALGQEKWGFIPYQLLPHLKWLTDANYTHVYYVDLKPKVTDARIFTPDADHPNGWGTVLIGGMRLGGSCRNCPASNGPPMSVTANFNGSVETRTFLTAYFALDITNPEAPPKLLWSFTDAGLGFGTTYPSILRVNPKCANCRSTDNSTAKWYMVIGSGPTGYSGSSTQNGKVFVVDLATGALATNYDVGDANAFMGDAISVDIDLDYRVDTMYLGNTVPNNPGAPWAGKMYRLTTTGCASAPCMTTSWGGTPARPTLVLSTFPNSSAYRPGPILTAPTVTMDDSNHLWLFFGTGRYLSVADKTSADPQYFFGIKDPVMSGTCVQASVTNCEKHNLLDVSSATVCVICVGTPQVSGIIGVSTLEGTATNTLQGLIATMDGWYTTLPTSGERVLTSPTLLGGIVFFPSFVPVDDLCESSGEGYLYALFYLTGSAYKDSVIGTDTVGNNTNVKRSTSLGEGLPSQMSVQIGVQGGDASGAGSGVGCQGQITLISQSSTGAASATCGKTVQPWSRLISWIYQRD
ncbi:MAG TPA: PilC/PilY family type IV pilus protein [Nitrospirales bacterium]|nr:PilC/PilY family type IV pilus protein [Nitrospirales bacterium]